MKKVKYNKLKIIGVITLVIIMAFLSVVLFASCENNSKWEDGKLKVLATTTMLTDLSKQIGGEKASVIGLMGAGIDPHQYEPSSGDLNLLMEATVIIYNGLHLEGKMTKTLSTIEGAVPVGEKIDKKLLLSDEENPNLPDPHIWFDVNLWKETAKVVSDSFSAADPSNKDYYKENLQNYLSELSDLDSYIRNRITEVPENQRVLITAHDAFGYFGKAYNFEVKGLQGISTETEAGTNDIEQLANYISENKINALFVESSVPEKTINSLIASVSRKNHTVKKGGMLYSDAIGDKNDGNDTYIAAYKHNIDTIVNALKG